MAEQVYLHADFSAVSNISQRFKWCICNAMIDGVRDDLSLAQGLASFARRSLAISVFPMDAAR